MTYLVTDNCIKCKHMDCVEVCPVDCFYEGENFLVINPDECIDCGVCVAECPVDAILPDNAFNDDAEKNKWYDINMKYSLIWPVITEKGDAPSDALEWEDIPNKYEAGHLSELPGEGN
jgi:ferredoxin